MNNKMILAIVGLPGSGKTAITKYLQEKYKWPKVYLGAVTFDYMKEHNIKVNYANEKDVRENLRKEHGPAAYAILSYPKIEKVLEEQDIVIVESLYSWAEYKFFKEKFDKNFKVMAAIARPDLRFERLTARIDERPMNSWEEFETRDHSQIENLAQAGPIAMADFPIINESSLENLHNDIDKNINQFLNL